MSIVSSVLGQKFMLFTGKDYDNLRVKASEATSTGFTKETKARRLQTLKK